MKLKEQFEKQTGTHWENSQGEPDIDYVLWLENQLQNTPSNSDYVISISSKLPSINDVIEDSALIYENLDTIYLIYEVIKKLGNFA
jgi:hypothetical protein